MTKIPVRLIACAVTIAAGVNAQAPAAGKAAQSASLEQRLRAMEDHEAILKVLHDYVYLVDFGKEIRAYTDLYTEDGVFLSVPSPAAGSPVPAELSDRAALRPSKGVVSGTHALEEWIKNEWRMRDDMLAKGHYRIHEMIAPDISIHGDTASARSYFQTTDNDNGRIYAVSIGAYKDELVRSSDGHWRIKERLLIRQGSGANPNAATSAANSR